MMIKELRGVQFDIKSSGLSLRGGGWGFPPATVNVALG